MMRRGFTIIEVLVVLIIIGIIVSIGTAQLLRTQPVSRDRARVSDVMTIKLHLEDIYKNGQIDNQVIPSGNPSVTGATAMGYPSTQFISLSGDAQSTAIFDSLDARALKSPRQTSSAAAPNYSLVAATNTSTSNPYSSPLSGDNDIYVYQPLDEAGTTLCKFATGNITTGSGATLATQKVIAPRLIDNCVKFNIYYYSEAKNSLQVVSSLQKSNNGLQ